MSWRERFNMSGPPLPRGVAGDTFFEGDPNFQRLARVFAWLAAEPGIGVITGEPGVGKTAAMRHLCRSLPQHDARPQGRRRFAPARRDRRSRVALRGL